MKNTAYSTHTGCVARYDTVIDKYVFIKVPPAFVSPSLKVGGTVDPSWELKVIDWYVKDKKGFNYGHFPVGTVCEVKLHNKDPQLVTVTEIVSNGPNSYVIRTNAQRETRAEDFLTVNINWVTRIVKRGPGTVTLAKQNPGKLWDNMPSHGYFPKHPTLYRTSNIWGLLHVLVLDYCNDGMLLDIDKLITHLCNTGVIRQRVHKTSDYELAYCANKKKLRKAIKQNINRFLLNHKKAQEELTKSFEDQYFSDLDTEFDLTNLEACSIITM